MIVLFPQMFSTTVGQSKCLYAMPEVLYFYDLKTQRHLTPWTKFCGMLGKSALNLKKLGMSWKHQHK